MFDALLRDPLTHDHSWTPKWSVPRKVQGPFPGRYKEQLRAHLRARVRRWQGSLWGACPGTETDVEAAPRAKGFHRNGTQRDQFEPACLKNALSARNREHPNVQEPPSRRGKPVADRSGLRCRTPLGARGQPPAQEAEQVQAASRARVPFTPGRSPCHLHTSLLPGNTVKIPKTVPPTSVPTWDSVVSQELRGRLRRGLVGPRGWDSEGAGRGAGPPCVHG